MERAEQYGDEADELLNQGRLDEAMYLYEKALSIYVPAVGKDHAVVKSIYDIMRTAYYNTSLELQKQGRLEQAMDVYEKALATQVRSLGESHADVGATYFNMAFLCYEQGKLSEAMALYEKALTIEIRTLGKDHPYVGNTYSNMARVLKDQGKLPEAMVLHERALAIRIRSLGEDHAEVGATYFNMAILLKDQKKLPEAMKLYEKALAIDIRTWGQSHAKVGDIYNNMAIVLEDQGNLAEAVSHYEKALSIQVPILGNNHPKVGGIYFNMALVLEAQGKLPEALALYEKALAVGVSVVGEDRAGVEAYNNMAIVLEKQGKLSEAMNLHDRALAVRIRNFGEEHEKVACTYHNMAFVRQQQGRFSDAMELYEKALTISVRTLGEDHDQVGAIYGHMAKMLLKQGKLHETMALHEKALAIRVRTLGEDHVKVGAIYNKMALLLRTQGELPQAMALYEKALNIRIRGLGEEGAKVVRTPSDAAKVLQAPNGTANVLQTALETGYDDATDSLQHWAIVGADPVGLTLALYVSRLMEQYGWDPAEARVTVYDGHMQPDGGRWLPRAHHRDRVVTLQDHVLKHLEEHALFRSIFHGERVWPNSRNCAIAELEEQLLQAAMACPFIQFEKLSPHAQESQEGHLAWFRNLNVDIIVVANGAASATREALKWSRTLLGDTEQDLLHADHVLGIGLVGDTRQPQSQALNVVLNLCQNRYLLNSIEGKRGYLHVRITKGEYEELFGAAGLADCAFGTPVVLHDCSEQPAEHLKMLEESVPWLERTITDGLKLFGMQKDHIRDLVGIQLRPAYVDDFFGVTHGPGGKRIPVLLVGDAAISHHLWPGRGLNTGLKAAVAAAHMWSGGGQRKPRWTSVAGGLFLFQDFMHSLREREVQRRSASMMRKDNMLPIWVDDMSGPLRDWHLKEKEAAKAHNEDLLFKAAQGWRDEMERRRPDWPHPHLSDEELDDKLRKTTVRPGAITVAIMQESARPHPKRPALSGWPVYQQGGREEIDPKDIQWWQPEVGEHVTASGGVRRFQRSVRSSSASQENGRSSSKSSSKSCSVM